VLVIDERRRIVRTNPATARILGADENGLAAQPLERFLDRESRTLLDGRIAERSRQPVHERRYWFPRGLGARRADGSEFCAEATLSCFESNGRPFHLLILRDVNDRDRCREPPAPARRGRGLLPAGKMDVKADCPGEELEALLAYTQEHSPVCNAVCRPVPVLVERARADVHPPSPTPRI
jgi:PAS domain S-box-containing protein